MANGKFVTYIRVSTARQGLSGLGLEAQQAAIQGWLNGGKWQVVGEFVEVESGKRSDRPELAQAIALCKLTGATLLIAKLDRLARNVNFVSNLMESKVEFIAIDFPQANRLTIHILAAVAEHEALMTSERTKSALQAAKARGTKLGGLRPGAFGDAVSTGVALQRSLATRRAQAQQRTQGIIDVIDAVQAQGKLSTRQIAYHLNHRAIPAPRGGEWSSQQVRRILQHA